MARKMYPEDFYFSPPLAIKRFLGLRGKYGDGVTLTRSEFKPEREAWITGVFLLGISQLTSKEYWLRPNNQDTAPDTFAISLIETQKGVTAEIQNIEIVEYERHTKTDLTTAIKNKLKNKAYPDNFLLLCYVHGRAGEVFRPREIFEEIKGYMPKVAQIWVLSSILSDDRSSKHFVAQVYPHLVVKEFDYRVLCNATQQMEMIKAWKDLTKKTMKVEFEPMGSYILKLP